MKKRILYIITILITVFLPSALSGQIRILTIGDSTMADYDEEKHRGEKEMRGWAQMLSSFTANDVVIRNAARNGRSSKSFYHEFWENLRETIKPGDYVFIQFGHNDEKANGKDTDENDKTQRGTAAWGQYKEYLGRYISESRERGATPILLTPIVRCLIDTISNTISDIGMHNLTELASNATIMNYPEAMRSLAIEMDVPLVDMTLLTKKMVEEYGTAKSRSIIYAKGDNTHLRIMGGLLFSQLAVKELLRQNILSNHFVIPNNISAATTGSLKKQQHVPIPAEEKGTRLQIEWSPLHKNDIKKGFSIETKTSGLQFVTKGKEKLLTIQGNKWAKGDIDMDATRYFELEFKALENDFYIDSAGFNIGSEGGSGMYVTVLSSSTPHFIDVESFVTMQNIPNNTTVEYKSNSIIHISKSKSLYLRIYPWYQSDETEKYIRIKDIKLNGILMNKQ